MTVTRPRVDGDWVRQLADRVRLPLRESDWAFVCRDLERVLTLVEVLRHVDTSGVEATRLPLPTESWLREDVVVEGLPIEASMRNAPARCDDRFAVPRMLD